MGERLGNLSGKKNVDESPSAILHLVFGSQDLWNIGLVHKNKKNYDEAAPMLDKA